jgi:hypothetical protein
MTMKNALCCKGIGVTPYASILNDLVFGTSTNRYSGVACKKVKDIFWLSKNSLNNVSLKICNFLL